MVKKEKKKKGIEESTGGRDRDISSDSWDTSTDYRSDHLPRIEESVDSAIDHERSEEGQDTTSSTAKSFPTTSPSGLSLSSVSKSTLVPGSGGGDSKSDSISSSGLHPMYSQQSHGLYGAYSQRSEHDAHVSLMDSHELRERSVLQLPGPVTSNAAMFSKVQLSVPTFPGPEDNISNQAHQGTPTTFQSMSGQGFSQGYSGQRPFDVAQQSGAFSTAQQPVGSFRTAQHEQQRSFNVASAAAGRQNGLANVVRRMKASQPLHSIHSITQLLGQKTNRKPEYVRGPDGKLHRIHPSSQQLDRQASHDNNKREAYGRYPSGSMTGGASGGIIGGYTRNASGLFDKRMASGENGSAKSAQGVQSSIPRAESPTFGSTNVSIGSIDLKGPAERQVSLPRQGSSTRFSPQGWPAGQKLNASINASAAQVSQSQNRSMTYQSGFRSGNHQSGNYGTFIAGINESSTSQSKSGVSYNKSFSREGADLCETVGPEELAQQDMSENDSGKKTSSRKKKIEKSSSSADTSVDASMGAFLNVSTKKKSPTKSSKRKKDDDSDSESAKAERRRNTEKAEKRRNKETKHESKVDSSSQSRRDSSGFQKLDKGHEGDDEELNFADYVSFEEETRDSSAGRSEKRKTEGNESLRRNREKKKKREYNYSKDTAEPLWKNPTVIIVVFAVGTFVLIATVISLICCVQRKVANDLVNNPPKTLQQPSKNNTKSTALVSAASSDARALSSERHQAISVIDSIIGDHRGSNAKKTRIGCSVADNEPDSPDNKLDDGNGEIVNTPISASGKARISAAVLESEGRKTRTDMWIGIWSKTCAGVINFFVRGLNKCGLGIDKCRPEKLEPDDINDVADAAEIKNVHEHVENESELAIKTKDEKIAKSVESVEKAPDATSKFLQLGKPTGLVFVEVAELVGNANNLQVRRPKQISRPEPGHVFLGNRHSAVSDW